MTILFLIQSSVIQMVESHEALFLRTKGSGEVKARNVAFFIYFFISANEVH